MTNGTKVEFGVLVFQSPLHRGSLFNRSQSTVFLSSYADEFVHFREKASIARK